MRRRSALIAGVDKTRWVPNLFGSLSASVAQLVEQLTLNQLVLGSSPSRGTIFPKAFEGFFPFQPGCRLRVVSEVVTPPKNRDPFMPRLPVGDSASRCLHVWRFAFPTSAALERVASARIQVALSANRNVALRACGRVRRALWRDSLSGRSRRGTCRARLVRR